MDKSFQTSFIPKKPIATNGLSSENQPLGILAFISIVLFVGTLVSAGGVYLYKTYLIKQKESAEKDLIAIRSSFEPGTIKELEMFDKRTTVSKQLLMSHTVMTPFFTALADSTLSAIQYTKFSIENSEKGVSVVMSGITRNYKYIALQSQVFNSSKNMNFKNVVFSNLVKDKNGNITFSIAFDVNPSLLSYSNYNLNSVPPKGQNTPPVVGGSVVPPAVGDPKNTKDTLPKTESPDSVNKNILTPKP